MAKKIAVIPPEARAKFPAIVKQYTDAGLSTKPAERETAERALRDLFGLIGHKRSVPIIWVSSPIVGALAAPTAAVVLASTRREETMQTKATVDWAVYWAVRSAVDWAVRSAVDSAVRSAVDSAVGSAVFSAVDLAVLSAVDSAVDLAVLSAVDSAVGSAVFSAVDLAVLSAVDSAVFSAVRSAVDSAVFSAVRSAVFSAVDSAVLSAVDSAVCSAVRSAVRSKWHLCRRGQFWAAWPAYIAALRECGFDSPALRAIDLEAAIQRSAGWYWAFNDFIMICDRPEVISRDHHGRLHSSDGPSVRFRDGWSIYSWRGLSIPAALIEKRHEMTPDHIRAISNAEHRRAAIEIYGHVHGPERFVADLGANLIKSDTEQGRPRKLYAVGDARYVHVINGSLEPDGSRREFLLGAHPDAKSPHDAVAMSYGRPVRKYREAVRT